MSLFNLIHVVSGEKARLFREIVTVVCSGGTIYHSNQGVCVNISLCNEYSGGGKEVAYLC